MTTRKKLIVYRTTPKTAKKPVRKTILPPHLRDVYMFAAKNLNKQGEYILPRAVMANEFGINETTVGRRVDQLERWHAIRKTLTGWDTHHRRLIVHFVLRNTTDFLQPVRRKDALSRASKNALSIENQPLKDALSITSLSANTHSGQLAETKLVSDVENHAECVHAPYNTIRLDSDNKTVVNRVMGDGVCVSTSETHSAPTPTESPLDLARRELEKIEATRATVSNPHSKYWTDLSAKAKAEVERQEESQ
ncbi:MAG: hypothetical protein ABSE82_15365 [Nitrososphaerales archaeon]